MAEVENFDEALAIVGLVVNQYRAIYEFANLRPFADRAGHARKATEQVHVVEQRAAKADAASKSSSAIWAMISARSSNGLCVKNRR